MRTYLECIPCIVNQSIKIARQMTQDEKKQEELLQQVLNSLSNMSYHLTPPHLGREAHRVVRRVLNHPDPFLKVKREFNRQVKALLPTLKEKVDGAVDRLSCAIRLAIAGNVIDFGPQHRFQLMSTIEEALIKKPAVDDSESLRADLKRATSVLYLGDNAGETFFDKILIKELGPAKIYYAVRGSAVINDATTEDAYYAGIDQVAQVVSNGSDVPGTILEDCSERFRRIFDRADLVIAKGHGNYETLNEVKGKKLYFLLMVKCKIIARDVGCSVGDYVVKKVESRAECPDQIDKATETDRIGEAEEGRDSLSTESAGERPHVPSSGERNTSLG
jgi:uncharacterized protein with ATP-grasp and redox domains